MKSSYTHKIIATPLSETNVTTAAGSASESRAETEFESLEAKHLSPEARRTRQLIETHKNKAKLYVAILNECVDLLTQENTILGPLNKLQYPIDGLYKTVLLLLQSPDIPENTKSLQIHKLDNKFGVIQRRVANYTSSTGVDWTRLSTIVQGTQTWQTIAPTLDTASAKLNFDIKIAKQLIAMYEHVLKETIGNSRPDRIEILVRLGSLVLHTSSEEPAKNPHQESPESNPKLTPNTEIYGQVGTILTNHRKGIGLISTAETIRAVVMTIAHNFFDNSFFLSLQNTPLEPSTERQLYEASQAARQGLQAGLVVGGGVAARAVDWLGSALATVGTAAVNAAVRAVEARTKRGKHQVNSRQGKETSVKLSSLARVLAGQPGRPQAASRRGKAAPTQQSGGAQANTSAANNPSTQQSGGAQATSRRGKAASTSGRGSASTTGRDASASGQDGSSPGQSSAAPGQNTSTSNSSGSRSGADSTAVPTGSAPGQSSAAATSSEKSGAANTPSPPRQDGSSSGQNSVASGHDASAAINSNHASAAGSENDNNAGTVAASTQQSGDAQANSGAANAPSTSGRDWSSSGHDASASGQDGSSPGQNSAASGHDASVAGQSSAVATNQPPNSPSSSTATSPATSPSGKSAAAPATDAPDAGDASTTGLEDNGSAATAAASPKQSGGTQTASNTANAPRTSQINSSKTQSLTGQNSGTQKKPPKGKSAAGSSASNGTSEHSDTKKKSTKKSSAADSGSNGNRTNGTRLKSNKKNKKKKKK